MISIGIPFEPVISMLVELETEGRDLIVAMTFIGWYIPPFFSAFPFRSTIDLSLPGLFHF